jgi:2-polyprenyl-3-methyl-5-hydroxy-6-metoxy-1,4-benzoquinol methylase
MDESQVREALKKYKFYHIIQLTDQISTPGTRTYVPAQQLCMKYLQSLDLNNKRVLDIGCRDGLFSFAAERMGAAEVIGIDNDLSVPATEFLIPYFNSKVVMKQLNLYDLQESDFGRFDVVIFPGVLYHLRYPFWGLKVIRDIMNVGGHVLIETPIFEGERNNAVLYCPIGDESPYESSSCSFFNEKGLRDTLTSLGFTTHSVEYCRLGRFPKLMHFARRLELAIKTMFRCGQPPPIKRVMRAVFHCTLSELDTDSFLTQYWERTHNFHTRYGGNM